MNKITDLYNTSVFFFNRHVMPKMNPEEKKITLIAVAVLGFITIMYTMHCCYRYVIKGKVTPVETKSNNPALPAPNLIDDDIPELDLKSKNLGSNTNGKKTTKKKTKPSLTVVPKSFVPTPPNGIPTPPSLPGGPPPPPGEFKLKRDIVETPAQRHLRLENAKIKRNKLQRLGFTDFYQQGSTLKEKTFNELQQQIIIYSDIVEQLSTDTILNEKFQEKIKSYQEKIDAAIKEIQAAKTVEMKLKFDDFKLALNKYTDDELKLILGCYLCSLDPVDVNNPIVKFYQSYPAGEIKDTCEKNQAIFKSLFDNCSNQYLVYMNDLIVLRADGKSPNPVYVPTEYDPKKPVMKVIDPAAAPKGDLMSELVQKTKNLPKWNGDIPIAKTANNNGAEDSELKQKLKQIGQPTQAPAQGATEAAPAPIGKALKPAILTEDKKKLLRANYILEKLELIAINLTKSGFDYTFGKLNEEKETLELCIGLSEDDAQTKIAQAQLADIQNQIDEIDVKKELALEYLKQKYRDNSDLQGAFGHPFMVYDQYKKEAEKYAEKMLSNLNH